MAHDDPLGKNKAEIFTNNNEEKEAHGKHPNSLKNLKKWEKDL